MPHSAMKSFLFVALLVLAGCASDEPASPRSAVSVGQAAAEARAEAEQQQRERALDPDTPPGEVLGYFLGSLFEKDFDTYHKLASTPDRTAKSLDSLKVEFAPGPADLITDFVFRFTKFQVTDVQIAGDTATVQIRGTSPAPQFLMRDAQIIQRDLGADTPMETKLNVLSQRYQMAGSPTEPLEAGYRLVKEDAGWRVLVGWSAGS
ncbi:MAG: hypothetical protein AAF752_16930 [Bacteroidota bacterium]